MKENRRARRYSRRRPLSLHVAVFEPLEQRIMLTVDSNPVDFVIFGIKDIDLDQRATIDITRLVGSNKDVSDPNHDLELDTKAAIGGSIVDTIPPKVVSVRVGSEAWSNEFISQVDPAGVGYPVPKGSD